MGMPAKNVVRIQDFPGLATRLDPDDLKAGGSSEQVNAQSHHPGELKVRPGIKKLTFQED